MKFQVNFILGGLLMVQLASHLHSYKIGISEKSKTKISESLTNETSWVRNSIDTLKKNANDVNKDTESIGLFIKVTLEISARFVPMPFRPLVELAASIFSAYFVSSETKKNNVTTDQLSAEMKELGRQISYESQRIIDEIKRAIVEHSVRDNLQKTLDFFDEEWNTYSRCFLTDDCPVEVKLDAFNQILIPSSNFRTKLRHFVTNFVNQRENERDLVYVRAGFFKFAIEDCEILKKKGRDCDGKNGQAIINRYAMKILMTMSQSYTMVVLANMIRYREHQIANRFIDAKKQLTETMQTIQTYHKDIKTVMSDTQAALAKTSNVIRRCDPEKHVKYQTYDYFRRLYGGFYGRIFDWKTLEVDRSLKLQPMTDCGRPNVFMYNLKCNYGVPRNVWNNYMYYNLSDPDRICDHGTISAVNMGHWDEEHKGMVKNYVDMNELDQIRLVRFFCFAEYPLEKANTWKSGQYFQRFVSLSPVEASPNHAITGLRWKFYDGILFLEIQQGIFMKGALNQSTIHWKTTDVNNPDYVTLGQQYGKALGFNLDDVYLPEGYYLTGVKFDFDSTIDIGTNKTAQKLIRMKIHGHHFSGDSRKTDWIGMNPWPKNIEKLPLNDSDVSEAARNNTVLSQSGKHFVFLQTTSEEKDLGQTTIPYLDIQPVESKLPLVGTGIYYKGPEKLNSGYGGYIGLQTFHRNFTETVRPDKMEIYIQKIKTLFNDIKNKNLSVKALENLWNEVQTLPEV